MDGNDLANTAKITVPANSHALVAIVCTKDRPERVREFVQNLAQEKVPPRTLLLVDSTSRDTSLSMNQDSLTLLETLGWETIHVLDSPGLPHQRNTGLDYVSKHFVDCEMVSFLDDDIFITSDYFETVQRVFESDPRIVVVGGFDLRAAEQEIKTHPLLSRLGILPKSDGEIAKSGLGRVPRPNSPSEDADFVPGGMQSLRLNLLNGVRFNEASSFFGEDIEMHFRLARCGRIVSSNELPVSHLNAMEGKQDNGSGLLNEQLVRLRLHLEDSSRVTFGRMLLGCIFVFGWEFLSALRRPNAKNVANVTSQFFKALSISLARRTGPESR